MAVHDFAYVTMAQGTQRDSLSDRLYSTPHVGAPPLIYHPCQGRASAAAPGQGRASEPASEPASLSAALRDRRGISSGTTLHTSLLNQNQYFPPTFATKFSVASLLLFSRGRRTRRNNGSHEDYVLRPRALHLNVGAQDEPRRAERGRRDHGSAGGAHARAPHVCLTHPMN